MRHLSGWVNSADAKSFVVEAADQRMLTFKVTDDTTVPYGGLKVGNFVEVAATEDDSGHLTAVTVKNGKAPAGKKPTMRPGALSDSSAPTSETKSQDPNAPPAEVADNRPPTLVKPPDTYDKGDDGPPKLRRGIPKEKQKSSDDDDDAAPPPARAAQSERPSTQMASAAPPPGAHVEGVASVASPIADRATLLLDKAREAAASFSEGLPNYVCQQFTTRYISDGGHPQNWRALDVVSAEVVYQDGKERYEKLQVNGKSVKDPEQSGAWSRGDFGSELDDLFSPATAADFRYVRDANIERQDTSYYHYDVDHEHSHWTVRVASQSVLPAFKGSVWISKENARVLRMERQAVNLPKEFPADAVESTVDYAMVNIGVQKFLLPVRAEVLMCERGSPTCTRNVMEFRNYHKYSGNSNIIFNQ